MVLWPANLTNVSVVVSPVDKPDDPVDGKEHPTDGRGPAEGADEGRPGGAVSYWVTLLGGMVFNGLTKAFEPFGVTPVQYLILYMCYRVKLSTVSAIAEMVPHDASTISRNVEKLRSMGLLTAQRRKPDRRVLHLVITDEGRSLMTELLQQARAFEDDLTCSISATQRRSMVGAMRRIVTEAEEG